MKRILSTLLVFTIMFGYFGDTLVLAKEKECLISIQNDNKIVLENGQVVTQEEFLEILESYNGPIYKVESNEIENQAFDRNICTYNSEVIKGGLVLVGGTWYIPGIGEIVVTVVAGAIVIYVGSVALDKLSDWVKDKVINWLQSRADDIEKAKKEIPSELKDSDGKVKLEDFTENVKNSPRKKDPKSGWTKERDYGFHWGRNVWKLRDAKGNRQATVDNEGNVISK